MEGILRPLVRFVKIPWQKDSPCDILLMCLVWDKMIEGMGMSGMILTVDHW